MAAAAVYRLVKIRNYLLSFPLTYKLYGVVNLNTSCQVRIPRMCSLFYHRSLPLCHNFCTKSAASESLNAPPKKKKTEPKPRITVIGTDEKLSVLLLEEAEKLAKRRYLRLMKVSDPDAKSERAVYKLVSDHAGNKSNKSLQSTARTEKIVTLSTKIGQHDIQSKIKKMIRWLQKPDMEIRVTITGAGEDGSAGESIAQTIEKAVSEGGVGRVVQKRIKDGQIKFSIIPPKKDSK